MALELLDPKPFFDFLDKCTNAESREAWSLNQAFHGGYYTEEQATAIAKWANDPKLHFPATVSILAVGQPPVGPRYKLALVPKLGTFKPVKRIAVHDRHSGIALDSMDAIYAVYANGSGLMRVSGNPDAVKFTSSILKEAFPASLAVNSSITLNEYSYLYVAQFNRAPVNDPFKDLVGKPLRFLGDKEYRIHGGLLTVGSPVVAAPAAPEPVAPVAVAAAPSPVVEVVVTPSPVAPAAVAPAPSPEPVAPAGTAAADDKWVEVPSSPEPKSATPTAEPTAPADPFATDLVAPTTPHGKRALWSKMNTVLLGLKTGDVVFVCTRGGPKQDGRGLLRCKLTSEIDWGVDTDSFAGTIVVCPDNSPAVRLAISFNGSYFASKPLFLPTSNRDAAVVMLASVGLVYNRDITTHSVSVADSITIVDSA